MIACGPARSSLSLMLDKRFIVVSGKGGVGKSAVAAAIAKSAARAGRNTLALSIVGNGMGLGAHLGMTALEFRPQQTEPNLHALSIDRSKALVEYVQIQVDAALDATPGFSAGDVFVTDTPSDPAVATQLGLPDGMTMYFEGQGLVSIEGG